MLDATNAAARDSVTTGTRRFFHWTPRPYAASIRFTGFRPSPFGVHVSTDPEYFRQPGDVRASQSRHRAYSEDFLIERRSSPPSLPD